MDGYHSHFKPDVYPVITSCNHNKGNRPRLPLLQWFMLHPTTGFKLQDNQAPRNSTHYFAFTRMPLSSDHLPTTDLSLSLMMIQASLRPSLHISLPSISNDTFMPLGTAANLCLAPIIICRF